MHCIVILTLSVQSKTCAVVIYSIFSLCCLFSGDRDKTCFQEMEIRLVLWLFTAFSYCCLFSGDRVGSESDGASWRDGKHDTGSVLCSRHSLWNSLWTGPEGRLSKNRCGRHALVLSI